MERRRRVGILLRQGSRRIFGQDARRPAGREAAGMRRFLGRRPPPARCRLIFRQDAGGVIAESSHLSLAQAQMPRHGGREARRAEAGPVDIRWTKADGSSNTAGTSGQADLDRARRNRMRVPLDRAGMDARKIPLVRGMDAPDSLWVGSNAASCLLRQVARTRLHLLWRAVRRTPYRGMDAPKSAGRMPGGQQPASKRGRPRAWTPAAEECGGDLRRHGCRPAARRQGCRRRPGQGRPAKTKQRENSRRTPKRVGPRRAATAREKDSKAAVRSLLAPGPAQPAGRSRTATLFHASASGGSVATGSFLLPGLPYWRPG